MLISSRRVEAIPILRCTSTCLSMDAKAIGGHKRLYKAYDPFWTNANQGKHIQASRKSRTCSMIPRHRLRRLGQLAKTARCIPVAEFTTVEDWVHESGRMVLLGQAAHPIPVSVSSLDFCFRN